MVEAPPRSAENIMNEHTGEERQIALEERLQQYYIETAKSTGIKMTMPYWESFNKWCDLH